MTDESDFPECRFSEQEFGALMEWYMVSDPWPLSAVKEDRIERMLDSEARKRICGDWVHAYHEFGGAGADDD